MLSAIYQVAELIWPTEKSPSLRGRLVKAATGTFGIRLLSSGTSLIISVFMARLLGAAGYGAYSYVMAWIALLGVPALVGLDRLLIRELAIYRTESAWNLLQGLLRWANRTVLAVSLPLALGAMGVTWVLAQHIEINIFSGVWLAWLLLPLTTLVDVRQAAMHGLNRVVASLLPGFVARPLCLLTLLSGAYLLFGSLNTHWVLGIQGFGETAALLMGTVWLRKILPRAALEAAPAYARAAWIRSAIPMMLISGMHVINHRTDTIMLGLITGAEAVGIYTVANRAAQVILLVQTAVNAALAPTIAALHAAGKMSRLQAVVTASARLVLLVSFSMALALALFGRPFLSLFGPEFLDAYPTLLILVAGCVVNTAAGSVSLLLVMTNYEREAAVGIGIGVVLSVLLNALLIPPWGVEGAALATSISMMVRNIFTAFVVARRLGIHSTAFGRIDPRLRRSSI